MFPLQYMSKILKVNSLAIIGFIIIVITITVIIIIKAKAQSQNR